MTKTTTNLLGMLITILAGTYFYITCCNACGALTKEEPAEEVVTAPIAAKTTSFPFAFSDGDYAYNENDNYNFNVSSSSFSKPLSKQVTEGVTSLSTFLGANAGKVINVTGHYSSDEANESMFPNLGLARANAVKNHFVENGISSAQINTTGKLMDDLVSEDGVYLGPITYDLADKSADAEDELNALYAKIKANPLILYFDTAEASINLTPEQRQKVTDISNYLDKVADSKASVIGHTDSSGKASTNMRLGQNRADFAKEYLVKNGLPDAKIIASSKGETQPTASNDTKEGQAKNRRTVVTLN